MPTFLDATDDILIIGRADFYPTAIGSTLRNELVEAKVELDEKMCTPLGDWAVGRWCFYKTIDSC